jgi:hypothetical protein
MIEMDADSGIEIHDTYDLGNVKMIKKTWKLALF